MPLLVRPSIEADISAITAIYAHAVGHGTASFEVEPPDEAEMARRRQAVLAGGYPYLVAEIDGTLAGYAYRFTVEDSIYVAPDRQGSGVGRALLVALIEACEALGFRQMVAVIGDSASQGSIRLHESLGFRPVGVLEAIGFKHGRWLDVVLMQRALGAATPPHGRT
jgi:phosphinothricin acetyltransferase